MVDGLLMIYDLGSTLRPHDTKKEKLHASRSSRRISKIPASSMWPSQQVV